MNLEYKYGELIPDMIVDTFYDQIKKCIDNGENYDVWLRNLLKINDNKVPQKIKDILN